MIWGTKSCRYVVTIKPVNDPLIADTDLSIATLYNRFAADATGTAQECTAITHAIVRSVFVAGPDNNIKLKYT